MSTQKRIPGYGNKNNSHANDQGNDSYTKRMYGSSLNSNYSNVNYSSSPLSSSNGFHNSSYMNNMSGVSGIHDTLEVSGSSVVSTGTMNKKSSAAGSNQFNMNRPISPFQGYPSVYSNKSETSLLSNTSGSSLYNSKGLIYSLKTNKELSSIDKINDPQSNTLIVAGKSHLGLYQFENNQGHGTIRLVKDVFGSNSLNNNNNNNASTSSTSFTPSSLNASKKKKMNHMLSTISDVKAGFNHYSNYVAITGTSTSVSLYDVKRADTPLVANFAEHTRSINSLDFHMGDQQSHMLITGGQDGTIKIWDLRKLSLNRMNKSDISINTMSESIRDVKWCPVWSRSENNMGGNNLDLNISTNGLHSNSHNMGGLAAHQASSTSLSSFTLQSNTLQASSQYSSTSSNDGNYFASIHDSGNLLKYDLRNYSQPERKLNAHSGPGLCLNWHPSGEYIITGGRDGKLCFWFVGEGKPNLFPEQVINVGSPISKLKFQPTLKNNHKSMIMNSNFAMSPLGDNSAVSVYNLSNKYIPKTVLTSGQNSLGFVWWDENLIFNIDQKNKINGWDMSKETEQITNMRKNSLKWRDIEGDGVVFVSQNQNLYTTSTPAFNTQTNISSPAPYSNSKSLSPIINYKNRHRMSSATVSSFLNNRNNSATSSNSQPGTHATSPTQILRNSDTAFQQHGKSSMFHSLTQPSLRRTQSGFSYTQNSSLLTPNTNSSYGHGPGHHHNGSIGSQNPHLGSILSNHSNTISVTDPALLNCFQSPKILTLDLPYIFNTIRKNKIMPKRENADLIKLSSRLKESPTEVFKFLARELKFSFLKEIDDQLQLKYLQEKKNHLEQDRQINKNKETSGSFEDKAEEQTEEKDRNDLMERLGISNTWSQLTTPLTVKAADTNNNEVKSDHISNTPNPGKPSSEISNGLGSIAYKTSHNNLAKTERTVSTSSIFSDSNLREQAKNLMRMKKEQEKTDFVNNLMESIAISEHNAETYLYIEDLTNFKLWIMIRDSLLWRLKKLMSEFEEGSEMMEKIRHFMSKSKDEDTSALIDPATVVARVEPTDVAEASSEYHYESDSENGDTSSFHTKKKSTKNGSFSGSLQSRAGSFDYEYRQDLPTRKESKSGSDNSTMKSVLDDVRSKFKKHVTVADENVISDDDEEDDLFAVKKGLSSTGEKPMEVLNRRKSRTSFVDTMMSSLRSGKMDIDDEFSKRKNSVNPLLSRAPTFSLTTPSSHSSATSSLLTREMRGKSIDENLSRNNFMNKVFPENSMSGQNESFDLKIYEPWAPEILIKNIYNQAVDTGNVLLSINILLLFQSQFNITSSVVVKNAVHEFMNILHTYELFEVSAELLKYCPWGEEILSEEDSSTGQSAVCLYCDKCGKVLVNENSKKKHIELQDKEIKFGYWYCDRCKKPNTLCALCEKPIKKLAVAALECGHVGHPECFTKWFVKEQMEQCPKGCITELLTI